MHPDRKIGIAMGILLIGVVAALFFRNEPLAEEGSGLSASREQQLNQSLRDRDAPIYLDDGDRGFQQQVDVDAPSWSLPELFDQMKKKDTVPAPIGLPARKRPTKQQIAEAMPAVEPPKTASTELPQTQEAETVVEVPQPANEFAKLLSGSDEKSVVNESKDSSGQFTEYVVQYGDTLSEISEKFLGSQARYKEIYEANKDRMASPDRLRVGKAIRIPRRL
ncbi:MAG: LysM peptidoglycan-binding domain-containing protein [Fuerstiella sp.]